MCYDLVVIFLSGIVRILLGFLFFLIGLNVLG